MAKMNGAQMVVKALEDENVSTVFGLPGGTVLHLYDALYDSTKLEHILMRHEQAASHAADGYARAGGKVGVCIATSGPGATNLVTGIATANLDSSPIVAITGQVATSVIGTDAFQEADIISGSMPFVKHSYQVRRVSDIQSTIHKAFHIAATGRPGPVLVDVPADIQRAMGEYNFSDELNLPGYNPEQVYDLSALEEVAEIVKNAQRPVIYGGGGVICSGAASTLTEFALKYKIPVTTTLLGKGSFPESHESGLSLGMAGMHGHPIANRALINADVIIAIGARFSSRTTGKLSEFGIKAKKIHIDIDAAEIDKCIKSDSWLIGDAKRVISELKLAIGDKVANHDQWLKTLAQMREKEPIPLADYGERIAPWSVLHTLREITGGECVITTEVGQNQMWAAQHFKIDAPRRFLSSGGLGTMGFGFPAAIGAAYACKGEPVCCIAGDGSFMMNVQELDTCARFDIPVKIILMNNGCLGNVRQWQELFYNNRYSNTIYSRNPDYVKLAESMGVAGFRAQKKDELRGVLENALAYNGPALVDVEIPMEAQVMPMVFPGEGLKNMVME